MAQDVCPAAVCRDPAVLLEYSVQVLCTLLQKKKQLSIAAPTVKGVCCIANQFRLRLPDPLSSKHLAYVQDASASCRSALQLRHQSAPRISRNILDRDDALRKKQKEALQCLDPCEGNYQEAQLEDKLLNNPPHCLYAFPYLCHREWPSPGGGKGDLVFTDGQGLFAVVEVKYINSSNNRDMQRRKRKAVKEQAFKYGQEFRRGHAEAAVVIAGTYTEEHNQVQWIPLDNQVTSRVRMLVQEAASVKFDIIHPSHGVNAASLLPHASRQATRVAASVGEPLTQPRPEAAPYVPRPVKAAHQTRLVPAPPNVIEGRAEQQLVPKTPPNRAKVAGAVVAGGLFVGLLCLEQLLLARRQQQRQREFYHRLQIAVACLCVVGGVAYVHADLIAWLVVRCS